MAVSIVDHCADGCVVSIENIIVCISLWSSALSENMLLLISLCGNSIKCACTVATSLSVNTIPSGFDRSFGDIPDHGHMMYFLLRDCLIYCDLADLLKLNSFCNPITGRTIPNHLSDNVSSKHLTIA